MTTWKDADRAYLAHSAACGECQGAGASLGSTRKRCAVGARLWQAYEDAGRPPHFTWHDVPARKTPMQAKPPRP